jgi:transposase
MDHCWRHSACHRGIAAMPANEPTELAHDNASFHNSHAVQTYWQGLAQRLQPFLLPLPAYTPRLNLIERLWRYLRAKLA